MATHKAIALIPAAGMGKRMGASINKQYLALDGMPIVARTIALFEKCTAIDTIFLVIPEEEIPYCQEHVVTAHGFKKVAAIVAGGKERQNSVLNGLKALRCVAADDDVILIHDGVRPLVTEQALLDSIAVAARYDGAVVAVPAKDTIKIVHNGTITATPPRESLWQAQTPQSFRYGVISHAALAAERDGFIGTDDASLVEHYGGAVHVVAGDYRNIKITTPEDLVLAESLLSSVPHR